MERLGFIYKMNQCIGCMACSVACKDKNHLESGTFFRRVETFKHQGGFVHYSGACNHCASPTCVEECPTNAMHLEEDLTVGHDVGKCIGCGACIWACPYGAVKFSEELGVATKCNSCLDLREKGRKPACVNSCITHCLDFDVITETDEKIFPSFLASPKKTEPSLLIVKKGDLK